MPRNPNKRRCQTPGCNAYAMRSLPGGAPKLEQAEPVQPDPARIHPKTISGTTIQDEDFSLHPAYYQKPETSNQRPAANDQLPAIPPDIHYLILESVGKII